MVFIFGFNFPLVETLFVMGIFQLISMGLLVWTLINLRKMNKKLDEVIREERIVKHELDAALKEETDQISLLAELMGNVNVIKKIALKKNQKIQKLEKEIAKAKKDKDKGKVINKAIDELKDVDKLNREEEHVLKRIGKDITKYAKKGVELPSDMLNSLINVLPLSDQKEVKKAVAKNKKRKA